MNRNQWLKERQQGIGGSEIAAVLGLSKWRTPCDVWLEKTSPIDDGPPNLAMELGSFLESFVVDKYREDTGYHVATNLEAISVPGKPWARCNLDGLITLPSGDQGVLEVKTAGDSRAWGEPGSSDVPADYFCQCQWNMRIADVPFADVPVLFFDHGRRIEIYHLEADIEFQEYMEETAGEFWKMVESRQMPDPINGDEAAQFWPIHKPEKMADADEEIALAIDQLKALKKEEKKNRAAIKMLESRVKIAIEDGEGIADGDRVLATWKTSHSMRLDTAALKAAHPELCREFTTTSTSRRLLVK